VVGDQFLIAIRLRVMWKHRFYRVSIRVVQIVEQIATQCIYFAEISPIYTSAHFKHFLFSRSICLSGTGADCWQNSADSEDLDLYHRPIKWCSVQPTTYVETCVSRLWFFRATISFIHFPVVPNLEHRAPFGVSVITHAIRHTVGLLWTSDQPVAEASIYTGQHNI
jgi:hypothetical protein